MLSDIIGGLLERSTERAHDALSPFRPCIIDWLPVLKVRKLSVNYTSNPMKVANYNGCKVYNMSSGKTMPNWLSETKKRQFAKDEEYRRRLELIQDFEMATAAQCIKMTKDGEHIIVAGTYPPLVRCYTVSDMAMKFQRGLTSEVVAFDMLSENYGKIAFLLNDRTINFHAPYGTHYSVRVPTFGRDIVYGWNNCDLFVASSSNEIYRLNLEMGQFKEPFALGFQGCNKIHINPVHQLLACGGESSVCEFWDTRTRSAVGKLKMEGLSSSKSIFEVSALKFDTDGLTLAVGTSQGQCCIYDIRSSKPIYTKEHQYGLPVLDVAFHNSSKHIISSDKKIVKIWDRNEATLGDIMTNIETPANINCVHVVEDTRGQSGMLMIAGEQSRIMTYFVPQLGPAPRWCSFLEGLTDELEETANQNVYEDYKFITKAEVEELGATGLIGTPMLKAYMHGFFVEMKLYSKLRAVSKPFEYEEHKRQKVQAKIDERRQSRIAAQKRLPKVNKALAEKLVAKQGTAAAASGGSAGTGSLVDDRFAALFKRDEFQQDETSYDYALRNPTRAGHTTAAGTASDRRRQQHDNSDDDELDEEVFEEVETSGGSRRAAHHIDDNDDDDDEDDYDEADDASEQFGNDQDDDEDLEPIRADRVNGSSKAGASKAGRERERGGIRGGAKRGRHDDSDEEGAIVRSSASRLNNKHRSNTTSPTHVASKTSAKAGASKTPRMFELAQGQSADKALFGHSAHAKSKKRNEQEIARIPLTERLKATKKK